MNGVSPASKLIIRRRTGRAKKFSIRQTRGHSFFFILCLISCNNLDLAFLRLENIRSGCSLFWKCLPGVICPPPPIIKQPHLPPLFPPLFWDYFTFLFLVLLLVCRGKRDVMVSIVVCIIVLIDTVIGLEKKQKQV